MLERTFDAAFFNRICNSPDVRPYMGGEGEIDVTEVVNNPSNYALRTEYGGFILIASGAGFYGVHTQFSAEGRGQHALAAMQAGLDFMFTRTDCMKIHSHCPDDNPAALAFARAGGARAWFRSDHPHYGPGQTVVWDTMDWIANSPALEGDGHDFHEQLERVKGAADSPLPIHADDPVHDRFVGAALRMARRGLVRKGVAIYNLWAAAGGYAPATVLSEAPPVVDIGDAVLGLDSDGELQVLQCR